jgi:cell wall-associated NlpC family hydrolase
MAALRPVAWSVVVSAAFAVFIAAPAYADPADVPDVGARPAPSGELRLPGAPQTPTLPGIPAVPGPLSNQILAAETEVALLGEQLTSLGDRLVTARSTTSQAEQAWRTANDRLTELRSASESSAEEAFKSAHELEPFGSFGSDLRELGRLLPRTDEPEVEAEVTPWDIARAEETERETFQAYGDALIAEQGLGSQQATVQTSFNQKHAALVKLRADNADQLARIEAEREAYEQSQAGQYGKPGINIDGKEAHPNALKAVQFAISQRGKPYEWGAEGPNRYDCSGLMWAAYRTVGVTLQRVAKDQYRTNTSISQDQLLPGDLVFFAADKNDWTSIHHVGMFIGDGKMVHSPTTGDVVKISTVWWSRFFGAVRIIPAVDKPITTPPPTTPPPTTPPPTTPPTTPPPTTPPPPAPPTLPPPSPPKPPRPTPPSETPADPPGTPTNSPGDGGATQAPATGSPASTEPQTPTPEGAAPATPAPTGSAVPTP